MTVFISYAPKDQKWARELAAELSERGISVWDAAYEVFPGDNWSLEIGKALERAQAVIVLVSPASARSPNVRHEIEYALAAEKFRDRLIPVIVKPTAKIPWILERLKPVRGNPSQVSDRIAKRLKATESSASHPAN